MFLESEKATVRTLHTWYKNAQILHQN